MERIEIHPDNVQELWELYENYLIEFRSENYSDAKPVCFEDYVYNEITYCENCGEYRTLDEMGESELALQDHICEYCMENGYGA
jgi:hypothetical protein